jgi:hypothetical protein
MMKGGGGQSQREKSKVKRAPFDEPNPKGMRTQDRLITPRLFHPPVGPARHGKPIP